MIKRYTNLRLLDSLGLSEPTT